MNKKNKNIKTCPSCGAIIEEENNHKHPIFQKMAKYGIYGKIAVAIFLLGHLIVFAWILLGVKYLAG